MDKTKTSAKKAAEPVKEIKYSKEQLLSSERFREYTDILNAVLPKGEYTINGAETFIKDFLNKEVN